jgi:hypothetical protein
MKRWLALLLLLLLAAGCGGERVAACDALLATVERVAACDRLDATQRTQVEQTVRSIKDALDRLEDVGPDRAPAELLGQAKQTCAKQDAELRLLYEKGAPECLR